MADRRQILAANAIFLSLSSLAAAFQLCGLMLICLIIEQRRMRRIGIEVANQYEIAAARLRNMKRRHVYRGRVSPL